MRIATTKSSMEVLRQQLANAQSRLVQSQTMPPPSTRQFNSWDSYQKPPSTPMALPRARDDNLHPADYYYGGSAADHGYNDPIRMPMYGSDLYSNTRGSSCSSFNQRVPSNSSGGNSQPHSINNPLFNSTESTVALTPSAFMRQPQRLGRSYPLFRESVVIVQGHYDLQTIRHNRTIGFSATPAPSLEGSRLTAVEIYKLISYALMHMTSHAWKD